MANKLIILTDFLLLAKLKVPQKCFTLRMAILLCCKAVWKK